MMIIEWLIRVIVNGLSIDYISLINHWQPLLTLIVNRLRRLADPLLDKEGFRVAVFNGAWIPQDMGGQ